MNASDARAKWGQLLDQVSLQGARVLVARGGSPVAALISVADLELLRQLEAERERDFAIIDEMRAAFKDVPPEEIERTQLEARVTEREYSARRVEALRGRPSGALPARRPLHDSESLTD